MKRLLCKWIPVCAMGAVLCACGGGVADGDYVSAFKEYVKSELKSGTWVLSADENLSAEKVDSIQVEILHEVTVPIVFEPVVKRLSIVTFLPNNV